MNDKIIEISKNFKFNGKLIEIDENSQGNINKTYILTFKDNAIIHKYLIQKINSTVFKEPYLVMKNIANVTKYIKNKLEDNNDTKHKTLDLIETKNNGYLYSTINSSGEKEYYRAYNFIENCISYDNFQSEKDPYTIAYNTGKGFGFFQKILNDFPIERLSETIKDFHNTPNRFNLLMESIKNDVVNRAHEYPKEIISIITKIKECSVITNNLSKTIPFRVTHNDTKVNNVLMDRNTLEAVAVIDLDTVMPGSSLFDIGDGIRSAASNTFEDDINLDNVYLNIDIAKAWIDGYLSEMSPYLTIDEIEYMGLSIKILTLELTIRFLTDYLNGDTYFKIKYKEHNRDRFLNQYTLLLDIEKKLPEINKFIRTKYKIYKKEVK